MGELVEILNDLIIDHWSKVLVGLVLFVVGRWWGKMRSRKEWRTREFKNRVTVSLNSFENNKLLIRTVLEKDANQVLLNEEAVATLLKAAEGTTANDPIVHVPQEDRWHVLNAILNEIAEQFKEGLFARDQGLPVSVRRYVFCITNEVAGNMKTRKIRVMMVQPEILESDNFDLDAVDLELPHHSTRIETLKVMREAFAKDASDFMTLEIVLRTS